jgi:hypothetical protein
MNIRFYGDVEGKDDTPAVARYLSRYGKERVREVFRSHLRLYFRWLREKGVGLTPEESSEEGPKSLSRP